MHALDKMGAPASPGGGGRRWATHWHPPAGQTGPISLVSRVAAALEPSSGRGPQQGEPQRGTWRPLDRQHDASPPPPRAPLPPASAAKRMAAGRMPPAPPGGQASTRKLLIHLYRDLGSFISWPARRRTHTGESATASCGALPEDGVPRGATREEQTSIRKRACPGKRLYAYEHAREQTSARAFHVNPTPASSPASWPSAWGS